MALRRLHGVEYLVVLAAMTRRWLDSSRVYSGNA